MKLIRWEQREESLPLARLFCCFGKGEGFTCIRGCPPLQELWCPPPRTMAGALEGPCPLDSGQKSGPGGIVRPPPSAPVFFHPPEWAAAAFVLPRSARVADFCGLEKDLVNLLFSSFPPFSLSFCRSSFLSSPPSLFD